MTHTQRARVLIAIVLAVGLLVALTGILAAQGGVNIQRVPALRIDHWLDVGTDLTVDDDVTVADALTVSGAATLDGGLTMDTNKFTVADTSGNTAIGGTLNVTGAATAAAGLTISNGSARVNDFVILDAATELTITDGGVITPTGSYQPLTAAGAVTATIATSGVTTGTLLILINTAAQNILIQDTGNQVLAGDATLNQYDALELLFDGTRWIERRRSDN